MKTYLNVPFKDKDKARSRGARWDLARKSWYVENVEDIAQFLEWMPEHLKAPSKKSALARRRNNQIFFRKDI